SGKRMRNLGDVFLASATANPDRPALWVDETLYTYGQLLEAALRVARELRRDADSAAPVAVLAQRSLCAYAGVLGAALAGRIFVPLNPRFPLERNRSIVDASGADALIADSQTEAAAEAIASTTKVRPRLIATDGQDRFMRSDGMQDRDMPASP